MNRIVTCSTQIMLTINVHNVYIAAFRLALSGRPPDVTPDSV